MENLKIIGFSLLAVYLLLDLYGLILRIKINKLRKEIDTSFNERITALEELTEINKY